MTQKPPSLARQAWNLAQALVDFVADGLKTVTEEQYRRRLETCDGCDLRRGNRCMKCGCHLSLKARGRAFKCPENKWPAVDKKQGTPHDDAQESDGGSKPVLASGRGSTNETTASAETTDT